MKRDQLSVFPNNERQNIPIMKDQREEVMRWSRVRFIAVGLTLVVAATLTGIDDASAATKSKKKMTLEQAWSYCKKKLDEEKSPGPLTDQSRFYRGGACMKELGFNL